MLRKFLLSLILAGVLTTGQIDTVEVASLEGDDVTLTVNVPDFGTMAMKYRAWNTLCLDYTPDRSCGSIAPPKIERVKMRKGLRGYYDGGDTVYVNRELRGYEREATTFHEMSHYLDTKLGLNPEMPVKASDRPNVYKLCYSEKRAWDATDRWWSDRLRTKKAANGKWVTWYDHCRPFADKLYPEIYDAPLPRQPIWFFRRWM